MRAAAFTIIAKNYLPFARVLMAGLRRRAPEVRRIVVLVDTVDGYFDPAAEDFDLILSTELEIADARWFHFKYTILELATAVKPYAAEHIFERYGADSLLFFDPDINIYSGLEPLFEELERSAVLLTPHLTAPLDGDRRPNELDILRSGTYNLGFVGLRRSAETMRLLAWWQEKVYEHCVVDIAKGLFVDQRWVDLVPGLFEGVAVLRDPGLNVAYWNLGHRAVTRRGGGFVVDGRPLMFFHFSGFDPGNPHAVSRHQDRFTLDDVGGSREILLAYGDSLEAAGYRTCSKWPYRYGVFDNGSFVPDIGRPVHHEAPELVDEVPDPFSPEGYRRFLEVWNGSIDGVDGRPCGITRLAYRIYKARPDVQAAMPAVLDVDRRRFLEWMLSSGASEHALSDAFVAPIRAAANTSRVPMGSDHKGQTPALVQDDTSRLVETLRLRGLLPDGGAPLPVTTLNQLVDHGGSGYRPSLLTLAIYESRPDLRRAFPDPHGHDALPLLAWLLTHGVREYQLPEELISPIRTQWEAGVASAAAGNRGRDHLERAARKVGRWLNRAASRMRPARRGESVAAVLAPAASAVPGSPAAAGSPASGAAVNLIGYLRSEMGVGESLRCAVRAARAAGLDVAVRNMDREGPYRRGDYSVDYQERHGAHQVNVFHVNADETEMVMRMVGEPGDQGGYNVGFWAWELEEFPDRWMPAFRFFDEVWTPSSFCQAAIGRKSPVPVIRIPHAIELEVGPPMDRASLGVPPDATVFIAIFDLLSVFERKNPLGAIEAFRHAFAGAPECHLILKVNHAAQRPADVMRIREAAAGLPVTIIDRTIDRIQVTALIQMSDCLVSLHRSEGFGLTMAEAMYLSKPVIATAYSGNMDFTNPENAYLVDYDMVAIPEGCAPYDEGAAWASPRLDAAVRQMRLVARDVSLRKARGRAGRDHIHTFFSPEAVGRMMAERVRRHGSR